MRFGGPELFEDLVHEARVLALFSEIFFNGRPQSGVAHRSQRELITNGRKLFRNRMRGQQPRQRLRVMRLDATFDQVGGFDRAGIVQALHQCTPMPRFAQPAALREGRITVALPGVVFSPSAFSSQISQSTKCFPPSTYFLTTLPLHFTGVPG